MIYANGEIIKTDTCYVWTYYGQELRIMLAASSVEILKFKIDTFLSFNKNILSKTENLDNQKLLLSDTKNLKDFTGGKGELMPPKYKDGSFRTRKSGILEYRFVHLDKYKSVYGKSEEICWNKRTDIIAGKKKEAKPKAEKINYTYGELLNIHLDRKRERKPPLSKSAISNIERCIRLHISDELKKVKLKELKPYMFENNLNQIESSRMREYTFTVFSGSLRLAKANGWIQNEIWLLIAHQKHKSVSYRPLENQEYNLLIKEADEELRKYIIGYCWTGCRRDELLTIKYEDVQDNEIKVWDKKTRKWKYIPLFPPLEEVIGTGEPGERIFKRCSQWVNTSIRTLCDSDKVKLYDISTHSLRNTFGSVLYEAGVDMKDIQAWLGHNTLKVTQDIYTKRRRKAMDTNIKNLIKTMFGND